MDAKDLDTRDKVELSQKIEMANKIVSKKYLYELSECTVKPLEACVTEDFFAESIMTSDDPETKLSQFKPEMINERIGQLFDNTNYQFMKINRFVYSTSEDIIQKMSTIYSAIASICGNIVFIIDSKKGEEVELYLGIQDFGPNKSRVYSILKSSFLGNFPGTIVDDDDMVVDCVDDLRNKRFDNYKSLAIVSGIANARKSTTEEARDFVQGIEKFIDSMKMNNPKKPYTVVVVADSVSNKEIESVRSGYEELYSSISTSMKSIINISASDSKSISHSIIKGTNESISEGLTKTSTHTTGKFSSNSIGLSGQFNQNKTESISKVQGAAASKIVGGALTGALSFALSFVGMSGVGMLVGNAASGLIAEKMTKNITNAVSNGFGVGANANHTWGTNVSDSVADAVSTQNTKGSHRDEQEGTTDTVTKGTSLQFESVDKTTVGIIKNIDKQLERMEEGSPYGMFNCCAYFLTSDTETTIVAANTYKALLMGENSSIEATAINYFEPQYEEGQRIDGTSYELILKYIKLFRHPVFYLTNNTGENTGEMLECSPASLVNGIELPLYIGLPRKSVNGLAVVEQTAFGRNIQISDHLSKSDLDEKNKGKVKVGKIYHMSNDDGTDAWIDMNLLTSHAFVTGSTGSGKSNTVFRLLNCMPKTVHKMIIEPAKGEYKNVIGGGYLVYGTNPQITQLLNINPFSFPAEGTEPIHVLEHIDRLIEILNACWPMYAAMPAVLKEAVEQAYAKKGWDLKRNKCYASKPVFPTFKDVMETLPQVMNNSLYSGDTKSDYMGALLTRVNSLTNGINGLIFCSNNENSMEEFYNNDVIVDISRVGSTETKSLIMGILIMKLQEYHLSNAKFSDDLEHITVIEEAHNLLKKTSSEQGQESANLQGKSIEMITNSIAEMRAYGEGFIIVDQAPGLLDEAVIRNTNTKIVMRLPEAGDREIVGKAMALKSDQLDEIAKLPRGVAVLYQNDWIEAVLCKFEKHVAREPYSPPESTADDYVNFDIEKLIRCILFDNVSLSISEDERTLAENWMIEAVKSNSAKKSIHKALSNIKLNDKEKKVLCYNLFSGKNIAIILDNTYGDAEAIALAKSEIAIRYGITNEEIQKIIIRNIVEVSGEYQQGRDLAERFQNIR